MKRTYEAWTAFVVNGGYNKSPNKHKGGRIGLVHCTDVNFKKRLKGMRLMESLWGRGPAAEYCKMDPPRPGYSAFDTWHINLLMGYYKSAGMATIAAKRMPMAEDDKARAAKFAKEYYAAKEEPPVQASLPFAKTEQELLVRETPKKGALLGSQLGACRKSAVSADAMPIIPFYFLQEKLGDEGMQQVNELCKWACTIGVSTNALCDAFKAFMAMNGVVPRDIVELALAAIINKDIT